MSKPFPVVAIVLALAACSSSSTVTTVTSGTVGGSTGAGPGGTSGTGSKTGTSTGAGSGSTTGAGSSTTTGGAGGTITPANFGLQFNEAFCKYALSCEEFAYAPYIISAFCNGTLQLENENDYALAVDAGRIAFKSAQASNCIATLQSSCNLGKIEQVCGPYLNGGDGLVAPAGACYSALDCLSEACTGNVTSSCTPGTCNGLVAAGGPCDCSNCGTCDPDGGLICNTNTSTCSLPGTVGQPCEDGTHPGCGPGLVCISEVCAAIPVSAGNACDSDEGECAAGTYCFLQLGASLGNCANQVAVGQPCAEDEAHGNNAFEINDNECAGSHGICVGAGTFLDGGFAPGTCAALSDVGGPCTAPNGEIDTGSRYNTGCYLGLNCQGGVCVKAPSSGTCSTLPNKCDIATSFCANATGNCTPYIAPGGTCDTTDNSPCGILSTCSSNGICEGKAPTCSPTL